jgi:hypothetical protein
VQETEVQTFAGICGTSGFSDGPEGSNLLNTPELVGVDALGYVFIYDAGNNYIRMVDPDGVMSTLIEGACMRDHNTLPPKIPFQLSLIPMLCYRTWIDTSGKSGVSAGATLTFIGNETCLDEHYINCHTTEGRPLIREKEFTVIEPVTPDF